MSEEQPGKDERFDELLGLLLDGEISDEDLNELAQLVKDDAERLDELRRQLTIGDQLAQSADGTRSMQAFREALEIRLAATSESDSTSTCTATRSARTSGRGPWSGASAAAHWVLHGSRCG